MKTRAFIEKFANELEQLTTDREAQLERKRTIGVTEKRIRAFNSPKRVGNQKIKLAESILSRAKQLEATAPDGDVSGELLWDAFRFILWREHSSKGAGIPTSLKKHLDVDSISKLTSYDDSKISYWLNYKSTGYVKKALRELGLTLQPRKDDQDDDF